MQLQIYYSDDYAGLDSGALKFYYGYEQVVQIKNDEEWCFVVWLQGEEVFKKTTSEIEKFYKQNNQLDSPKDYLLAGIGIYLLLN